MSELFCEYCNRNFAQSQNLKKHYERCKLKSVRMLEVEFENLKNKFQLDCEKYEQQLQTQQQQHEQQLQAQQQQHEQQLQAQQQQHEQQIQTVSEKLQTQREQYERQLQNQQLQIERLEGQIFEIAKQPKESHIHNNNTQNNTHNNQRIMNIINQLIPMNLSEDDLRHLVTKYYTTDTFLGGPESIAQMTVDHILIDQESGKFRVVCTDTARGIFYYQDADNNLIRDIGMQAIQEKLIAPLNEATRLEYERLEKKKQMNPNRLMNLYGDNLSCIRNNELPNRVKKSIQLPIQTPIATPTATIPDTKQHE